MERRVVEARDENARVGFSYGSHRAGVRQANCLSRPKQGEARSARACCRGESAIAARHRTSGAL